MCVLLSDDGEQTASPYIDIPVPREGHDGQPGPRGLPGLNGDQGPPGPKSGGLTYVRWGRSTCPNITGTELVYKGRAAGSYYGHKGGGGNYQCITEEPENFDFSAGTVEASLIYGVEYQLQGNANHLLYNEDVPCAVCYVATRDTVLMIPGTYKCPHMWTQEYYGWLMADAYSHHRTTFECVDVNSEATISGHADQNGALFYHVEPRCGCLPCPPYEEEKEMTCTVCTR